MRVVLIRTKGNIEFGIIYGGIALLVLVAARLLPVLLVAPSCLFKDQTGIACPTCGATRAVSHLSRGELAGALALNPLIAALFIIALFYFIYSVIRLLAGLPNIVIIPTVQENNIFRVLAIVIFIAQWAYLVYSL